jgi:hypothetical protein
MRHSIAKGATHYLQQLIGGRASRNDGGSAAGAAVKAHPLPWPHRSAATVQG